MIKKPKLVLIDLDGTLVDSVPDLAVAVDKTMIDLGLKVHGEDKVRNWVGNGVERLVKRMLTDDLHAEPDEDLFAKAYPIFFKHYTEANGKYSRLFPGVKLGLEQLRSAGFLLACVTNKAESFTLPLLAALGILEFFGTVVSGDTLQYKKPRPEPLLHAAKFFAVNPNESLMIGDSMHDVEAARNAGFAVVAVSYGYNHGVDIRAASPDAVVDSFSEIDPLFCK